MVHEGDLIGYGQGDHTLYVLMDIFNSICWGSNFYLSKGFLTMLRFLNQDKRPFNYEVKQLLNYLLNGQPVHSN